ncbi:MAG: STAS domain-containing protein [Acidobacteriota bacterium]
MQIDATKTEGKWTVMAVSGRIDGHTAPEFEAACKAQLDKGTVWLAVDLAGVQYMSSAGLRVLLATLKSAKGKSGGMALVSPQENVREVLEISGFSSIFSIVADVQKLS